MLYFDPKQLNGATIQPFRPREKQTASSPKVAHISFFSFQILHLIMFVVKPAATSFLVVIVLGSILEGHVANAHNRRRSDETIRRRTLRGNDGPSPPPPLAEILATNALEDVLVETASFWGRNLQGSGSFGKGKGGSGKGGRGGGKVRHRYVYLDMYRHLLDRLAKKMFCPTFNCNDAKTVMRCVIRPHNVKSPYMCMFVPIHSY